MEQLQTTFYIIAIIFMVLYGLLLVGIVILLFYIWKKVSTVLKEINDKLESLQHLSLHPGEIASSVGEALAGTAINQVKKIFQK